jgi:hypothetical protein
VRALPLALTIAALFLFQAANMGLYAYIIGLGEHYGLQLPFITGTLGVAAWLGLGGAGLVVILSDRLGYLKSLVGGIALTVVGTWALYYSNIPWVWVAANCLVGITWAFTIAYLLGLMAHLSFPASLRKWAGLGPAVAVFLGQDDYARASESRSSRCSAACWQSCTRPICRAVRRPDARHDAIPWARYTVAWLAGQRWNEPDE